VHRGAHETVDEHRTGFLIDLVFDGIAVRWDLDNDIYVIGNIFTATNPVQNHNFANLLTGWELYPNASN
jgi:hypothetical protein